MLDVNETIIIFLNRFILLFKGYTAGAQYDRPGSGSNYLCLHEDPQWKTYLDGDQNSGLIGGAEYEFYNHNSVFSKTNNGDNSLEHNPAPCAVCYAAGRSTILMVPARTQCPDGWTTEYAGYLASQYTSSTSGYQRTTAATFVWTRHRKSQLAEQIKTKHSSTL